MRKLFVLVIALSFWMNGCYSDVAGTTEETNAIAFWDEKINLEHWTVIEGADVKLELTEKKVLSGKVVLGKKIAEDGLARAGLEFDVSDEDGNPANLAEKSEGICVAYESEFDVEIQLDLGEPVNDAKDNDLPYVGMHKTTRGVETHCHRWSSFRQRYSYGWDGEIAAMTVKAVRMVFVGQPSDVGTFKIERVGKYEDNSDFSEDKVVPKSSSSSIQQESSSSLELSSSSVVDVVMKYGSAVDLTPNPVSQNTVKPSFLWDGEEIFDLYQVIETGAGVDDMAGLWMVNYIPDSSILVLPDGVEEDVYGNLAGPWAIEYKGFKGSIKVGEKDSVEKTTIEFYVAGEDVVANVYPWGGFCVHYKSSMPIKVALVGDLRVADDVWYAELMPSENMVWAKIGWDAFVYNNDSANDGIAAAIGMVSKVGFGFSEDGDFFIDKFGSYDQCGE